MFASNHRALRIEDKFAGMTTVSGTDYCGSQSFSDFPHTVSRGHKISVLGEERDSLLECGGVLTNVPGIICVPPSMGSSLLHHVACSINGGENDPKGRLGQRE